MKSLLKECILFIYILFIFSFVIGIFSFPIDYSFEEMLLAHTHNFFIYYSYLIAIFFFFLIGKAAYFLIIPFFIIALGGVLHDKRLYKIALWIILDVVLMSIYYSLYHSSSEDIVQGGIFGNLIVEIFLPIVGKFSLLLILSLIIACSIIQFIPIIYQYLDFLQKKHLQEIFQSKKYKNTENKKMWSDLPVPNYDLYHIHYMDYYLNLYLQYRNNKVMKIGSRSKNKQEVIFKEKDVASNIPFQYLKTHINSDKSCQKVINVLKEVFNHENKIFSHFSMLLNQDINLSSKGSAELFYSSKDNNSLYINFNQPVLPIQDTNNSMESYLQIQEDITDNKEYLNSNISVLENDQVITDNLVFDKNEGIINADFQENALADAGESIYTLSLELEELLVEPEVIAKEDQEPKELTINPEFIIKEDQELEELPVEPEVIAKEDQEPKELTINPEFIIKEDQELEELLIEPEVITKEDQEPEELTVGTDILITNHLQPVFQFPPLNILTESEQQHTEENFEFSQVTGSRILSILQDFNIQASLENITIGPVATRYEIIPPKGLKVSKISDLADNITLELASSDKVRIEAPVYGKSVVGIEVPNKIRDMVTFKSLIANIPEENLNTAYELPFIVGKNLEGEIIVRDIAKMPHLLVAGSTGSGKSVCINTLIHSLLFTRTPDELKMILIDPKRVELVLYNNLPHLITPVIKEVTEASKVLKWLVQHMEERYQLLEVSRVRNIIEYNQLQIQNGEKKMPYIVLIMDEFADLILIGKRDIEDSVIRLAAMARAVGIHLILATQRPSADVITGLIKANFPSRIAFRVSSKIESRIILDENGAENLLGKGDMLFMGIDQGSSTQRIQAPFLSDHEVRNTTDFFKQNYDSNYWDEIFEDENDSSSMSDISQEPLFKEAVEIVLQSQKASASYIQRRLKIGYNRAARIIELMEEVGIVGKSNGSKPREILISSWDE